MRTFHIFRVVVSAISARLWTLLFHVKCRLNGVDVGKGLRCTGPVMIRVHPKGKLIMGDNVVLNASFSSNPVGSSCRMIMWVGPGALLNVGSDSGISHSEIVCMNHISIGNRVKVGGGVKMYDSNFHSLDHEERSMQPDPGIKVGKIDIGDDVFIGAHTMLLKGSILEKGAVVGAYSLVCNRVPAFQVYGGNPCRPLPFISNRVNE